MKKNIVLFIFISITAFSQETLTLEKAIQYSLSNSKEILIAKNDVKIIKNLNHLGAAGMLPNIIISSGYNGSINDAELEFNSFLDFGGNMESDIEATQAKSSNLSTSIGLNYRLFNGFNGIYTLSKFKNQNLAAKENIKYKIENTIIEITQQYFDLLNKKNIYQTFNKSYLISLDRYNQTLERYNLGSASKINLLNAEVNLNQDKINKEEARIAMKSSKLNMSLLLGLPIDSFTVEYEFKFNQNLSIDDLLNKMNNNNSSLIIAKLNYKIANDELKIAKSNFTPSIDLFSSYSYNNRQSETSFISRQKDYGIVVGFNVEIPIFSANMRRKNFQNAKISLESKNLSLQQIKETIEVALKNSYYSYIYGLSNLNLLKKNLETIKTTANINKELYDLGQITNLEYRDSQLLLDQATINYYSKLSSIKIQEYIIYQLSGQLQSQ
ncbi:MAG: hypothetical protein CMP49_06200 [Flavobacteriales bacterium]|nr:hypothetical protein [Flavobacteriales bacterium]|tara:strand:+ start:7838 stop:9157 length:1320 start_codon:yes stop_codon:yes gene_type:complete